MATPDEYVEAGDDAKAYVSSYLWILRHDEALALAFRADTLQYLSPEEWNAACNELRDYAERKAEGIPPDYDAARVVIKPATVQRLGDPRGDSTWTMLPPAPNVCSQCAVDHPPELPHDNTSLYYQYAFHAEHQRWPTWDDAMAHCTEEVREEVAKILRGRGVEL